MNRPLGIGRAHNSTTIKALVNGPLITIINATTGDILPPTDPRPQGVGKVRLVGL